MSKDMLYQGWVSAFKCRAGLAIVQGYKEMLRGMKGLWSIVIT